MDSEVRFQIWHPPLLQNKRYTLSWVELQLEYGGHFVNHIQDSLLVGYGHANYSKIVCIASYLCKKTKNRKTQISR